jgi:very-short-patch-repair endonuclease
MGEGWGGGEGRRTSDAKMKKHPIEGARDRARTLRRGMTVAENSLWRILRSRQIEGQRFRRQVPLGRYIVDFLCHQARLVIEVDGGQHEPSSLQEAERSRFLKSQGYRVLRFWNHEILENPDGVHAMIVGHLRDHPHPTLLHRGGEPNSARLKSTRFSD